MSEPGLGSSWLEPCARTSEGTSSFLKELECRVSDDTFLDMLRVEGDEARVHESLEEEEEGAREGKEIFHSTWWLGCVPTTSFQSTPPESSIAEYPKCYDDMEDTGVADATKDAGTAYDESLGYVFVEHQDAVDAMAEFLAAYLVTCPEAKNMGTLELQTVVKNSLKEMRSSKRLHTVIGWGRMFVTTLAVGYGSLATAYSNPWVVRAILKAIYTCFRFSQSFW